MVRNNIISINCILSAKFIRYNNTHLKGTRQHMVSLNTSHSIVPHLQKDRLRDTFQTAGNSLERKIVGIWETDWTRGDMGDRLNNTCRWGSTGSQMGTSKPSLFGKLSQHAFRFSDGKRVIKSIAVMYWNNRTCWLSVFEERNLI